MPAASQNQLAQLQQNQQLAIVQKSAAGAHKGVFKCSKEGLEAAAAIRNSHPGLVNCPYIERDTVRKLGGEKSAFVYRDGGASSSKTMSQAAAEFNAAVYSSPFLTCTQTALDLNFQRVQCLSHLRGPVDHGNENNNAAAEQEGHVNTELQLNDGWSDKNIFSKYILLRQIKFFKNRKNPKSFLLRFES